MAKHILHDWASAQTLQERELVARERFRESHRELQQKIRQAQNKADLTDDNKAKHKQIQQRVDNAVRGLEAIAAQAKASLERMAQEKIKSEEQFREFQISLNIKRPVRKPDRVKTFSNVLSIAMVEAGLTAGLFYADGFMPAVPAFATGVAVAGINAISGVATGFFCGRYAGYKLDAARPLVRDRLIRGAAWGALGVSFLGLCTLHFGAARVRVLGEHSHIFNFDDVSLAATFNDYFALALMGLGTVGAAISFFKGRHGLSDPIPEYSAMAEASDGIIHTAEQFYQDTLSQLDQEYEATCEDVETACDDLTQNPEASTNIFDTIHDEIIAHNHTIDNALDTLRMMQADDLNAREVIIQKSLAPMSINESAFEALRMDMVQVPYEDAGLPNAADLLAPLHTAYQHAVSAVHEAYSAFASNHREFTINNPTQEAYHAK